MAIQIVVPVWNRKKITELSLYVTNKYKGNGNKVIVYNDHSTEYDNNFLAQYSDEVIRLPTPLGVEYLRLYQMRAFLKSNFKYLYFTDNDAIHDPLYIDKIMELYSRSYPSFKTKLPITLYNNYFHIDPTNQVYETHEIAIRNSMPGISAFFNKEMVEKMIEAFDQTYTKPNITPIDPWDYLALKMLNLPCITTKISYVEHFGESGLHTPKGLEGMNNRSINPTEYLKHHREDIINYVLFDGKNPIERL